MISDGLFIFNPNTDLLIAVFKPCAQKLSQRRDVGMSGIFDGGQQQDIAVLPLQIQQLLDGGLLGIALQLFVITADKTVKILSRIFMIPVAQVCAGRNVFQPKRRSENLFADAARIEAVDKDGGLLGIGLISVNALYGKHYVCLQIDSGRLKIQTA